MANRQLVSPGTRFIALHAVVGAVLLLAGLLGLDRVLAESLRDAGHAGLWLFHHGTSALDTLTGHRVQKYLLGALIAGGALALMLPRATRPQARDALLVGATQLASVALTSLGKHLFQRLRPLQLFESGDWSHVWFAGGGGFPSGHAAFYFGLCLPLAWLFPRWRWPLAAVAWFVAAARVDANAHFLSDVAAALLLAAVLTLALARLAGARPVAAP